MIIFDCDGVLVDSEALIIDCEIKFLERYGIQMERAAYLTRFMGIPPAVWIEDVIELLHTERKIRINISDFDPLNAEIEAALERDLKPIAGMHDVLKRVSGRCCVASSSSTSSLAWKLDRTGLLPLVNPHVYSTELVARGKPYPDVFLHAAQCHDWDPSVCVVVEDSVNGVKAAKAAGMSVVGFVGGGHSIPEHADTLLAQGANHVVDCAASLSVMLDQYLSKDQG